MDASVLRQSQINEWYYHLKLESLFISQLCFIGLSFVIVLFSLSRAGLFGPAVVYYSLFFILIILFTIWIMRFIYNRNYRDKRNWNRIVFSGDNGKPATIPSEVVSLTAQVASCKA